MRGKAKVISGALAAVLLSAMAAAPSASAAASGCSGDVCQSLTTPSGGTVYIRTWANTSTFYGYFTLTGPGGLHKQSATQTWNAGGTGWGQTVAAIVGQYCSTGYSTTLGQVGNICHNVE